MEQALINLTILASPILLMGLALAAEAAYNRITN